MNSFIKLSILTFLILGLHMNVFAKQKRGVGNLISKLRNNPEKDKLKDDYDPRAHLYAKFLNSSFANATLPNTTEDFNPVYQQQEVIHGKGLLDMFKPRTTIDPKEKLFMLYLKSLNNNETFSSKVGSKSVTQANEVEIMETTCSIKPNIDCVQNHLMSENKEDGCSTTVKDDVNEQETEATTTPCDTNNVMTSATDEEEETESDGRNEENVVMGATHEEEETASDGRNEENVVMGATHEEEETASDGRNEENVVITNSEKVDEAQENKVLTEETSQKEWYPNEIKYLFPDQL